MRNCQKRMMFLFLMGSLFLFNACTNGRQGVTEIETVPETNEEETVREVEFGQYYETESVTESLSERCDYVLCEGEDGEDYYELVANEEEDYQGVKIKVGVIKNNKWILKPTSKMPLVDKDKTLYGSDIAGLEDAPESIYYMGSGCFLYRARTKDYASAYEEIIYNVNNKKYYEQRGVQDNEIIVSSPRPINYTTSVNSEGALERNVKEIMVSITQYESNTVAKILNLSNMKAREINIHIPDKITVSDQFLTVHPLSEEIFAIAGKHHGCTFYSAKGKELFTISYNEIPSEYEFEPIIFEHGECNLVIKNNKGTVYKIVVNKKGKVIKQIEWE